MQALICILRDRRDCVSRLIGCLICFTVIHVPVIQAASPADTETRSRSTIWLLEEVGVVTESVYFSFHLKLEAEARDEPWATETQEVLRQHLTAFSGFMVAGIECRTNLCEIRAETSNTDFGPWMQAISAVEAAPWFKANFAYSTGAIAAKDSNPNSLGIYWNLTALRN